MSSISWAGVCVGGLLGAILRVGVAALHFPETVGEHYVVGAIAAGVGLVIGAVAAATGRPVLGGFIGASLSLAFYLTSLPVWGFMSFLGSGTLPTWWEALIGGAIPGVVGGAVGRRRGAGLRSEH